MLILAFYFLLSFGGFSCPAYPTIGKSLISRDLIITLHFLTCSGDLAVAMSTGSRAKKESGAAEESLSFLSS